MLQSLLGYLNLNVEIVRNLAALEQLLWRKCHRFLITFLHLLNDAI